MQQTYVRDLIKITKLSRSIAQCIHVSVLNSNGFLTDVEKRGAKQTECTGEEGILIQFS